MKLSFLNKNLVIYRGWGEAAYALEIPGAKFGCVELDPLAEDPQTMALGF